MATSGSIWRHDRIRASTAPHVNDRIDQMTRASVERHKLAARSVIIRRLVELDQEWDVERVLIVNFAILGAVSSELGRRNVVMRWLFRSQMAFLLMHGVVGWCPPLPLFRRMNVRSTKEIQGEREALLAILRDRGEPIDDPMLDSLPPVTP